MRVNPRCVGGELGKYRNKNKTSSQRGRDDVGPGEEGKIRRGCWRHLSFFFFVVNEFQFGSFSSVNFKKIILQQTH